MTIAGSATPAAGGRFLFKPNPVHAGWHNPDIAPAWRFPSSSARRLQGAWPSFLSVKKIYGF